MKLECIKSCSPTFTKGKVYEGEWSYKVVTSPPRLLVTDDLGNVGHIIAEGTMETDEWFIEHFEIEGESK